MDLGVRLGDVLPFFFSTLFGFWPLIVLSPITWRRPHVRAFLQMWGLVALVRVAKALLPGPGLSFIPEPLSTILFIVVGAGLVVAFLAARRRSSVKK
jgi:hypothetical protein